MCARITTILWTIFTALVITGFNACSEAPVKTIKAIESLKDSYSDSFLISNAYMDIDGIVRSNRIYTSIRGLLAMNEEDFQTARKFLSDALLFLEDTPPDIHLIGALVTLNFVQEEFDTSLSLTKDYLPLKHIKDEQFLVWLVRGLSLEAKGRYAQSSELYKRLSKYESLQHPLNYYARLLLANSQYQLGNVQNAIRILKEILRDYPEKAQPYRLLGRIYAKRGDVDKALLVLKNGANLAKNDGIYLNLERLYLYLSKHDFSSARALINEEVSASDYLTLREPYQLNTASVMLQALKKENYSSAKEYLDKIILSFVPLTTLLKIDLATNSLQNVGSWEIPLVLIYSAYYSYSTDRDLLFFIASTYERIGFRTLALNTFLDIPPSSRFYFEARATSAALANRQGNPEKAMEIISPLLSTYDFSTAPSWFASFAIDTAINVADYDLAMRIITEVSEKSGRQNPIVLFKRAIVEFYSGKKDRSLKTMKQILQKYPNDANALNFVAYFYAEIGSNLDEALKMINKALSVHPSNGFFIDTLGWIFYKKGDLKRAEKVLSRAASIEVDDPVILYHYAIILEKTGKTGQAVMFYARAANTVPERYDKEAYEAIRKSKERLKALIKDERLKKLAEYSGYRTDGN